MSQLGQYRKAFTALATGWLGWAAVVIDSKPAAITASEWLALGVVTATALGVYGVPNEPRTPPPQPLPPV